jgi:hypothetical protein
VQDPQRRIYYFTISKTEEDASHDPVRAIALLHQPLGGGWSSHVESTDDFTSPRGIVSDHSDSMLSMLRSVPSTLSIASALSSSASEHRVPYTAKTPSSIIVRVYGPTGADPKFISSLFESIEARLAAETQSQLAKILTDNPMFHLSATDIHFMIPDKACADACGATILPPHVTKLETFLLFLEQNLLELECIDKLVAEYGVLSEEVVERASTTTGESGDALQLLHQDRMISDIILLTSSF